MSKIAVKVYDEISNSQIFLVKLINRSIVRSLNLSSSSVHMTEAEFSNLYKILSKDLKFSDVVFEHYLAGYKITIDRYPELSQWDNVDAKDKLIYRKGYYSNLLYYFAMVICGRLKPDLEILFSGYKLPYLISDAENKKIENAMKSIGIDQGSEWILRDINRLMLITGKELTCITEDDFYDLHIKRRLVCSKAIFYTLKALGNFNDDSKYKIFNKPGPHKKEIVNDCPEILDVYHKYVDYLTYTAHRCTKNTKEQIVRILINWIWCEARPLESFDELTYDDIKDFVLWLKTDAQFRNYSKKTINPFISRLRGFILFLIQNHYASKDLENSCVGRDCRFSDLYYDKSKTLPEPIIIYDRIKIERMIFELDDERYFLQKRMLILLYLLGLRPSEMFSLRLDCIRGIREVPKLYVHRAKKYKERYIPLIDLALKAVLELKEYNKDSIPVYLDYDGETHKRLFHDRGVVLSIKALEEFFKDLLTKNGIVDAENVPKYSLYVLRRIRITTWLEYGLTNDEVAYLVGHEEIDSHNNYIVSKEIRMVNAGKVYAKFYKDMLTGNEDNLQETEITVDENYIEDLKNTLLLIESKSINKALLEESLKCFPMLEIPVPCGKCAAKAIFDEGYECFRMNLPCLDCDDFVFGNELIEEIDKYLKRLFEIIQVYEKNGRNGLKNKAENIAERLMEFYVTRFNVNRTEAACHFDLIKKSIKKKKAKKNAEAKNG